MSANLIALQNRFLGRGETVYDRLARLRQEKGAVSDADISALAGELGLPPAHVRTVAKFYDDLAVDTPAAVTLRLCNGEACEVAGASACQARLERALADAEVRLGHVTCLGYCGSGPNAVLERGGERHVMSLAAEGAEAEAAEAARAARAPALDEPRNAIHRSEGGPDVLLRSFVGPDGSDLAAARERGAYRALERAVGADPERIIEEVEASRIRGRGGAGFPAGTKLRTVRQAPSKSGRRYVVVNADEGDAGAYIDKELMERAPHTVIEGMVLAAFAVGANEGFVYLRGEYPRARRLFGRALEQAREAGYLGGDVAGSGYAFDARIVDGHGAYICGEETSLLRSLEGVPAQVTPKPPYPAIEGLRGAPTAVQNVETLAALPFIVEHGGARYAALGHANSRGTKLVSLNTTVARPGLYEVELGTTLRTLIFDLAGGMADGKRFKAVQVGGPLGGIFGEQHLDLPLDFEALAEAGGMLGHAGVVVYPDDVDLVAIGRGLMRFCAVESCGKCFPCRIGSVRGTEIFDKILAGRGTQADLDLLAELDETMRWGSLCALGGAIPIPIDNLLDWFIDDFRAYVPDAVTPSRVHRHLED